MASGYGEYMHLRARNLLHFKASGSFHPPLQIPRNPEPNLNLTPRELLLAYSRFDSEGSLCSHRGATFGNTYTADFVDGTLMLFRSIILA